MRPIDHRPPADLAMSSKLQSEVLEDLASAVNYIDWYAGLTQPWLGADPLEVGSGLGSYAAAWAAAGQRITVSEADLARLALLQRRFADEPLVDVRQLCAPIQETGSYSAVVALNVLEHIEDDVGALRSFRRLVRPGGHVVLVVPAFQLAMSDFDRQIGHHRRYSRPSLERVLRAAGLRPVLVRYSNSIGLLGWLVLMRWLGRRPTEGFALRAFDRAVVPPMRRLEARLRLPFGQSVLAVAQRVDPEVGTQAYDHRGLSGVPEGDR